MPKAATRSFTANDVLELQISLKNCGPKVERTIVVRANITFADLHYLTQIAMGWTDVHILEFKTGKKRVGMEAKSELFEYDEVLQEDEVRLFELMSECKGRFV